jgi:hypothetical protein
MAYCHANFCCTGLYLPTTRSDLRSQLGCAHSNCKRNLGVQLHKSGPSRRPYGRRYGHGFLCRRSIHKERGDSPASHCSCLRLSILKRPRSIHNVKRIGVKPSEGSLGPWWRLWWWWRKWQILRVPNARLCAMSASLRQLKHQAKCLRVKSNGLRSCAGQTSTAKATYPCSQRPLLRAPA